MALAFVAFAIYGSLLPFEWRPLALESASGPVSLRGSGVPEAVGSKTGDKT